MKNFLKIKINQGLARRQAGLTYVELIVVLGIFVMMTSVILFNYGDFQAKVDIKNLASDIALKIVEAQKSSLSGELPAAVTPIVSPWKPSYGVHFNINNDSVPNKDAKSFIYFSDLDNNKIFDGSDCAGECLDKIAITKGYSISALTIYPGAVSVDDLTITFARPISGAIMYSNGERLIGVEHAQISIISPGGKESGIKIFPSGRIQID